MISIIICTRRTDGNVELRTNIQATVGIEHEVIIIDNSKNTESIFSAYNKGVHLSKYPYLLFMHDDVSYKTTGWGSRLVAHFKDPKVGAVGVAGTHYMSYTAGGWWSSGIGHLYLLQSEKADAPPEQLNYLPPDMSAGNDVVVLDGVWFSIRKELFNQISFDQQTFNGFHFYDVDITLQVFQRGYKLLCIKDILIHHLSMGVLNKTWVENAYLFHQKWKHVLPISLVDYSVSDRSSMEYRVLNELLSTEKENKTAKPSALYYKAFKNLLSYKAGLRYFKTPVWAMQFYFKFLSSKLRGR